MLLGTEYERLVASAGGVSTLWSDPEFLTGFGESRGTWRVHYQGLPDEAQLALPYFERSTPLGTIVTLPPLLRYCAPVFAEGMSPAARGRALADACERISLQYGLTTLSFDPSTSALLPEDLPGLQWRPTYVIQLGPEVDPTRLPNKTMRRRLRRAREHWQLRTGPFTEEVHDVLETTYHRQGITVPYDRAVLGEHFKALAERGLAVSHQAVDAEGRVQGASIVIADQRAAYCWVSGSTDVGRAHDAGSLVLAEDVAWAHRTGRQSVDFLGSALPGPAENRRQLGGQLTHYAYVQRDRAWWAKARRWWRNRSGA